MRFGILFEVAIEHDYWLNVDAVAHGALTPERQATIRSRSASAEYLQVGPTPETRSLLAGHGLVFKALRGGFLVGVEVEEASDVPRRPIAAGLTLRFALRVNADFAGYTAGIAPRFYRFSGASGNEREGQLFLTLPVAAHDPSRAYAAGEIRTAPAGAVTDLYQALRDTGPSAAPVAADWRRIPADTHDPAVSYRQGAVVLAGNVLFQATVSSPSADLEDPSQWTRLGALAHQYVTAADRMELRPELIAVDVKAVAGKALEVRVTREGAAAPAWQRRFEGATLDVLQADLRGLGEGVYRLEVLDGALAPLSGFGFAFYLSGRAIVENWFGVIEIGAGSGAFELLDGTGRLRSPRYHLRFINQVARPRYRFPRPQATGAGAEVVADASDARVLVTPEPLPMTRVGGGVRLRADNPATAAVSEQVLLPHPGARALSKQGGQWFSDVHLANLPPLA